MDHHSLNRGILIQSFPTVKRESAWIYSSGILARRHSHVNLDSHIHSREATISEYAADTL